MSPGASSGCLWSSRACHSARSASTPRSSGASFSMAFTAPPRRQSSCGISAWPARPGTRMVGVSVPRQLTQASNPVDSALMPASARTPCSTAARLPAPPDSSSVTVHTTTSPASRTPRRCSVSRATTMAATPPFMSAAPRPYSQPSRSVSAKGSLCHSSRGATSTASMWPLSSRLRPPPEPARTAASCGRPAKSRPGATKRLPAPLDGGSHRSQPAPSAVRRRASERCSFSSSRAGCPARRAVVSQATSSARSSHRVTLRLARRLHHPLLEVRECLAHVAPLCRGCRRPIPAAAPF